MTLVLFDIDGTLTATNGVDAKCFAEAFQQTFGFSIPTTDWDVYRHCTDTGIIHEVLENARGIIATPEELDTFEKNFEKVLAEEFAVNEDGFKEIPGAAAILNLLQEQKDLQPIIATGGMRRSACYKLSRIGIDALSFPAGFANDCVTRHGIAQCAIERCNSVNDDIGNMDVVYVGDGPWDVRTSAEMGMRFVGITGDASPDRLLAWGATVCLEDYQNVTAFFEAIRTAQVPFPKKKEVH